MKTPIKILWTVWSIAVAVTAVLYFTDSPWALYSLIATIAFFGGAEIVGAYADFTYSQFVGDQIAHPVLRWGLGVVQSVLAMLLVNVYLGAALFLVLPAHFVFMRRQGR